MTDRLEAQRLRLIAIHEAQQAAKVREALGEVEQTEMTIADVAERVKKIAAIGNADPEAAHSMEDDLYKDVLREIASGNGQSQELAYEALEAAKIEFPRWCA